MFYRYLLCKITGIILVEIDNLILNNIVSRAIWQWSLSDYLATEIYKSSFNVG